jgi:hypothetical protein
MFQLFHQQLGMQQLLELSRYVVDVVLETSELFVIKNFAHADRNTANQLS